MRRACAMMLVLCSPLAEGAAQSRPSIGTAMLDYRAADSCPRRREFMDMVQSRIGYLAFRDDAEESFELELAQVDDFYEARLRRGAEAEVRELRAGSCEELAESAATIVALQLDPFGDTAAAHQEAPREALDPQLRTLGAEPPPTTISADPSVPVDHAPPTPSWRLALTLDGGASVGRVPRFGLGLGAGLLLATPRFFGELGMDVDLTPGITVQGGRSVFAYAASAVLSASYRLGPAHLGLGARAGAIVVRSTELDSRVRAPTASLGVVAGLSHQVGNTRLRLNLLGEVALNRVQVSFADERVWTALRFTLTARLGVAFEVVG